MEQHYPTYLIHYGIQGQKWGVRRFQNEDGTWTSEGLERRRELIEKGAHPLAKEVRVATKEGKAQVRYNKMLAKSQNAANKKFDKLTTKMERDKKLGLNPSEKDAKKAIKLGTQVRQFDQIAKNPNEYYKSMSRTEKAAFVSGILGGIYGLPVAGAIAGINAYKSNKYYSSTMEKMREETIKDLKKHKII